MVVKGISSKNLDSEINYALLGNTIKAMKWFYSRIAIIAFILLISLGSYYINNIIKIGKSIIKITTYIGVGSIDDVYSS